MSGVRRVFTRKELANMYDKRQTLPQYKAYIESQLIKAGFDLSKPYQWHEDLDSCRIVYTQGEVSPEKGIQKILTQTDQPPEFSEAVDRNWDKLV